MATTNNNKRTLHRKEWQMMTPAPTASVAGSFLIKDPLGTKRTSLFVAGTGSQYLYASDEDAWLQTPSMALAGTFGAGSCGAWVGWSNTLTATGGTTTTLTLSTAINNAPLGQTIRFLSGTNIGREVTVTDAKIVPGGTSTLTFTPALASAVTTETFAVSTGRYFVWNAGTMAAGSFKSIDPLTGVITSLSVTSAPATFGTDGRLVGTPSYVGAYATGTATAGTSTTLVNSAKTWTTNQWSNYQVRITAGTGIGQVRSITSNTGTTLTVPTWTTTPDATSVYAIEANDDYLYLLGNNAVTMYRYSISGNSWSTISPGVARAGAPVAGMSANWAGKTGDSTWANESDIQDGRYIYSFRGGASTLDRYDIALNTWAAITYIGAAETFSTGSSYDYDGSRIYIRKDATNRFFYYSITGNNLYPFSTLLYPDGTAVIGDKLITVAYKDGATTITWIYSLRNSGTEMHRVMVI